jgi:hypothetical protein
MKNGNTLAHFDQPHPGSGVGSFDAVRRCIVNGGPRLRWPHRATRDDRALDPLRSDPRSHSLLCGSTAKWD